MTRGHWHSEFQCVCLIVVLTVFVYVCLSTQNQQILKATIIKHGR